MNFAVRRRLQPGSVTGRYLAQRLSQGVITIVLVTLVVFLLGRATGDPVNFILGPNVSDAQRLAMREQLGLLDPLWKQAFDYVAGALYGDFGTSLYWDRPTAELFLERLPATLELAGAALLVVVMGIPLGILSAVRPDGLADRVSRAVMLLGQSMPTFWVGIVLIQLLSGRFGLPTSGRDGIASLILPALALGWSSMASVARLTRSATIDALESDFIRLCRLKGLGEAAVIWKHSLRNASLPVTTLLGVQFGYLVSGAVTTEVVFSWPGIGSLAIQSILTRDFPQLQTTVLLGSILVLLISLVVDLLYGVLDPRVRLTTRETS